MVITLRTWPLRIGLATRIHLPMHIIHICWIYTNICGAYVGSTDIPQPHGQPYWYVLKKISHLERGCRTRLILEKKTALQEWWHLKHLRGKSLREQQWHGSDPPSPCQLNFSAEKFYHLYHCPSPPLPSSVSPCFNSMTRRPSIMQHDQSLFNPCLPGAMEMEDLWCPVRQEEDWEDSEQSNSGLCNNMQGKLTSYCNNKQRT